MPIVVALLAVVFYLCGAAVLGRRLARRDGADGPPVLTLMVLPGLALHGLALYQTVPMGDGWMLGVFETASLMAWAVVLALLAAALVRPVRDLGVLVLPAAALAVLANLAWPSTGTSASTLALGTQVHVALSVAAYALLALAACQAVFLAIQERRLAGRRALGPFGGLPALQVQESLLFQSLALGFFLLSLSLVSGVMFVDDLMAQHLAHKTALSALTWLVFAVLLWGRWRHGWRGRTATRWTLSGFVLLALAYFGSKAVLELLLGRSWEVGM